MIVARTGWIAAPRRSIKSRVAEALLRSGFLAAASAAWTGRLTVLGYHRIAEPSAVAPTGFVPNVSATPEGFAEQMRLLARWFDIISMDQLVAWLRGDARLPRRAALITFDDGYRDNLDVALPILREHRLPAALFVATGCIGSDRPFYWDLSAFCFARTRREHADLPLVGARPLVGADERRRALHDWIAAAKLVSEETRRQAVEALPAALDVTAPAGTFAAHHLDWDQVRAMASADVSIGAHTVSHPILNRLPLEEARWEIAESKRRIEEQLGRPISTFAYPNGQPGDFDDTHAELLREAGFEAAFTLETGPARYVEVQRAPFRIRRLCITYKDDLPRFALKVAGFRRLTGRC